ncbi:putative double-stranded RNA/RNA-DNA hybrid binding protein [Ceratocystis lukuohia]|uniref:Double-stranded RNA/RNA-DNA hybrid binding protein n=1 Tax=Ceratocystis lukuohia TaxID=2019550 RepID=A0ABR4MDI2_9PEZI
MLYMAELLQNLPSLGYADDGVTYISSTSVQTNVLTPQTYMTQSFKWCRENELRIDCSKTGVMHLYTGHGSHISDTQTLEQAGISTTEAKGKGSCSRHGEVAYAEAIAALKAVRAVTEVVPSQAKGLNLYVDNLGVVKRLVPRMQKPGTLQLAIDEIRRILARWEGGSDNLALEKSAGKVHWVPGHCEVPGNEAVDQLAKVDCKSKDLLVPKATMSLTTAGRWRNEAFKADFRHWIKENCPKIRHLGGALN